jgi:predicted dehydrogenase
MRGDLTIVQVRHIKRAVSNTSSAYRNRRSYTQRRATEPPHLDSGHDLVGIGLVGYGYWGPKLARNFAAQQGCLLVAICETSAARRALAQREYRSARVTADFGDLLADPAIHAVLIAVPVSAHYELARRALLAGKDVLLEKPMTASSAEARDLIRIAHAHGRVLAVDHTYLFTGAVRKIKELVDSGALGEIMYLDSVRINLGLFQNDVNVLYDLAPHDLSIMDYVIDCEPLAVQAMGRSHTGDEIESMAYLHVEFPGDLIAHFHFNWLAPVKIRRTLIGGTKQMIVYDDMEPSEKVKVYDKGVVVRPGDIDSIYRTIVDYRTGDMLAPKLSHHEALAAEAQHFVDCVARRSEPLADGSSGLRVVRLLEAAQESLRNEGRRVAIAPI